MTVSITSDQPGKLTIAVDGRFDFADHQAFREAYARDARGSRKYEVDMRNAQFMDSSALGMLLQLRDHAGGQRDGVTITHCNEDIGEILRISNFHKLFEMP
ncbi:MAG: STAS domain-containing protein [Chromatiales bacterium]|nr:STAS domain-containing protein [Chromatiales bacterium]